MEQDGVLLFVYGTLKRGLANHHQLRDARFVGTAQMPGVQLYDLGPFPMAIAADGLASGELYRVDDQTLAHLDRFEGVPRLYRREWRPLGDGRKAWIYLGEPRQVRHSPRLEQGCWPPATAVVPSAKALLPLPSPAGPRAAGDRGPLRRPLPRPCLAALLALIATLPLFAVQAARAEVSLAQCRRWQSSSGLERILLGNAIGAGAYLTKVRRFAESNPEHPQLLYAPADLQRACDSWS